MKNWGSTLQTPQKYNFRQIAQFPISRDPSNGVLRRKTPMNHSESVQKLTDTSEARRDLNFDPRSPKIDTVDPWGNV